MQIRFFFLRLHRFLFAVLYLVTRGRIRIYNRVASMGKSLFKSSMTLCLTVTVTLKTSGVQQNLCHSRCFMTCFYLTLSLLYYLPNITLIFLFHEFSGLTINKFHDFPGLENEIPKFHVLPAFP